MSSPWVIAAPEYVAAAAADLENIGSSLSSANMAALMPTSGVLAAGGDEVSAMIAALFSSHAQAYQALSTQAASFHAQFVQLMNSGASQYALTEAANISPLLETVGQDVTGAVQALTGSPLVGGGASAATPIGNSGSHRSLFGSGSAAAAGAKVAPTASVPTGGVTALTGNGAAGASNFAAAGGTGGNGVNAGLMPSNAAAVANPIAAGNGAAAGSGGSVGLLSSDVAADGTGGAPATSPLLNSFGVPSAAPLSGSGGVSENNGGGGVGRLGVEASTNGGQQGSGGDAGASGDAGGGDGATGTIGELREGRASFYGSQAGDEGGAAAAAAIPS